ncbi:hypothetical protein Bca4012_014489 [Brassica carinata]
MEEGLPEADNLLRIKHKTEEDEEKRANGGVLNSLISNLIGTTTTTTTVDDKSGESIQKSEDEDEKKKENSVYAITPYSIQTLRRRTLGHLAHQARRYCSSNDRGSIHADPLCH